MSFSSYLPNRDADLLSWAISASGFITSSPVSYGLSSSIATAFASAVGEFQTSLAACEPGIRNKMAVTTKNEKKALLKSNIRAWVGIVDGTATVSDSQRQQLGLTVRAMPSPVPAPSSKPVLSVKGVDQRTVTIRLRDVTTGALRGKPKGCIGATVYSYVGATPPADVASWNSQGSTGKTLFDVAFDTDLAAGSTVWLTAAWIGTRLENGPACTPIGITFGAAGVYTVAA